jgi:hypothetical protein
VEQLRRTGRGIDGLERAAAQLSAGEADRRVDRDQLGVFIVADDVLGADDDLVDALGDQDVRDVEGHLGDLKVVAGPHNLARLDGGGQLGDVDAAQAGALVA